MSHDEHLWMLANGFVKIFNEHRVQIMSLTHLICIYKYIPWWYGNGGDCIKLGLSMYIVINRNPDNGIDIKEKYCGVSGTIIV